MPLYNYIARDKTGKRVTGRLETENPSIAAKKLKEMGYAIINISEEKKTSMSIDIGAKFGRIKLNDKVTLYTKLASMLKAGVPLAASLNSVKEQISSKRLKNIVEAIYTNITTGNSLSQSLALYPNVFPDLLVNVVKSGEVSGKLTDVLELYSEFAEKQAELRSKIISAMTYPCIMIIAAIGLMIVFFTFLLPKFMVMFKKINVPLPLPTQILVNAGDFFKNNTAAIFIGIFAVIIFLIVFPRFKIGKKTMDIIKLKLPLMGKLIKKVSLARFTRTLGTLYTSGVPIVKTLEICENSTGNSLFAKAINGVKEGVSKGKSFAEIMSINPIFPQDMVQMISIGEQSGNLPDMLNKVSEFYEKDVDYAVKNITTLIEPFVLLMVGLVIGFLAYSIIMPIFNMMQGM